MLGAPLDLDGCDGGRHQSQLQLDFCLRGTEGGQCGVLAGQGRQRDREPVSAAGQLHLLELVQDRVAEALVARRLRQVDVGDHGADDGDRVALRAQEQEHRLAGERPEQRLKRLGKRFFAVVGVWE